MTCNDCIHAQVCGYRDQLDINPVYYAEQCEDFKDKSRFAELPRKVYIIEEIILNSSIRIDEDIIEEIIYNTYCGRCITLDEIGKTVFFTSEEAERAAKNRKTKSEGLNEKAIQKTRKGKE